MIVTYKGVRKMKEVMISIQPKWVEKIAKGEKTIEAWNRRVNDEQTTEL
jgi:hypothetical protein